MLDDDVPLVNTPPLAATIVAVGKSSTLNPEPFALTFTEENIFVLSVVTTFPENPVPFRSLVTDIAVSYTHLTLPTTPYV